MDSFDIYVKAYKDANWKVFMKDAASGTCKSRACGDIYSLAVKNNDVAVISESSVTLFDKSLNQQSGFTTGSFIRVNESGDAIWLLDSAGMLYKVKDGGYTGYDTGLAEPSTTAISFSLQSQDFMQRELWMKSLYRVWMSKRKWHSCWTG